MFSSRKSSAPASGALALTKSLRFRSSASAYLNKSIATTTNQKTFTWSGWVKRGTLSSSNLSVLFGNNASSIDYIGFYQDGFRISFFGGTYPIQTNSVYRDTSAWYHIVVAVDTTQATASNRVLLWINGTAITSFSSATYPAQNYNTQYNTSGIGFLIGQEASSYYFDGYLTDVYFIDGQALTPSSFGATNATTGQWSPAKYSGSYGTNGFHLTFTNTTSTTTLGYDTSGNSNNWTTNNISLTAGSTYDSMNDVPVAYSATAANYAVMNPLKTYNATFTNGNLDASVTATSGSGADVGLGGFGMSSGKWYWEVTCNSITAAMIGISDASASASSSSVFTANGWAYYSGGQKYNNNSGPGYAASFTNGDIIGVALDMDAGTLAFYKNGASQGVAYSTGLTGKTMIAMVGTGSGSVTQTYSANFGQRPFAYTPPSGYNALNTYNLPTPTIAQGNKYMDATLWNGGQTSPFNVYNAGSFQPDFVWAKERSGAASSRLYDVIRGTGVSLSSNSAGAEGTETNPGVSSFNSNGFTITNTYSPSVAPYLNDTSQTYVGWQWQAGAGSSSSNTNGSITSTVSASTTAGFSVVTYTGTGANATVGHGLGVAPSMIIIKSRSSAGANWNSYHVSLGNSACIVLNLTIPATSGISFFNATTPTSTVFSLGTDGSTNPSGSQQVAYCFAPIAGYSAFGSYTGNGSATGPFVYTGFRPRFVMIKITSSADNWFMCDTARGTYNDNDPYLLANSSGAEVAYTAPEIFSNGFCLNTNSGAFNSSGSTYIYMAFAENPFKYANAR